MVHDQSHLYGYFHNGTKKLTNRKGVSFAADVDASLSPKSSSKDTEVSTITVQSPRVQAADSCRGIGILVVIFYHMGYQLFMNAWVDISLFFCLSGFLITKSTIEAFERQANVDIIKFWAKRISRIFPLLLLAIVLIVLSQKLPFRHNNGIIYQREAADLWYATIFATNYNLVYLQPDDYFDGISAPSVTRHLWTLSIEEQYYIVWPLVIWTLSKLVLLVYGNDRAQNEVSLDILQEEGVSLIYTASTKDSSESDEEGTSSDKIEQRKEKHPAYKPYLLQSVTVKYLVRCIFMLDLCVMIFSYFSSWATIDRMGITAAYYSTWCRMGDIAGGGFAYSFSRLHPYVARRWYQDPTLKPLTKAERIFCEMMSMVILCVIGLAMFQIPFEDMLVMYFTYLRVGMPVVCFGVVAVSIQLTEELPKWTIFTKLLNSKAMKFLGIISYGAYVIHWPILVYFGDPNGRYRHELQDKLELDQDTTVYELNLINVFFFLLTFVIAYASFFKFELPFLVKSRNTTPWKTVITGLSAMGVTLIIIWLVTKDLPPAMTFENDLDQIEMNSAYYDAETTSMNDLNQTEPAYYGAETIPINIEIDNRYTPIVWVANKMCTSKISTQTRSTTTMKPCYAGGYTEYEKIEREKGFPLRPDSIIVIQCKNLLVKFQETYESPCNIEDKEFNMTDSYWFWIESDVLCGDTPIPPDNDFSFSERCPEKFTIDEVKLNQTLINKSPITHFYNMFDRINEQYPGIMNQNFVSSYKHEYDEMILLKAQENFDSDPIRITIIGESVGVRIGMFWKDYLNHNLPELGYTPSASDLPSLQNIANMAVDGHSAVAYWLCKSRNPSYQYDDVCDPDKRPDRVKHLEESVRKTKPDIVVIHDGNWLRTEVTKEEVGVKILQSSFDRALAFNLIVSDGLENGVDSIIYLTQSPCMKAKHRYCAGKDATEQYFEEVNAFMKTIDALVCPDDSTNDDHLDNFNHSTDKNNHRSSRRSMKVSVVDWAKLICPTIGDGKICPKSVHGFKDILPDNTHPYGDSGEWLAEETLSVILAKYAFDHGYYSTFDDALENPMSSQLLTMAPPDGNPTLKELVTSFTICPYDDFQQLEETVNKRREKSYESFRDSIHAIAIP